jgi:hypothetical protein
MPDVPSIVITSTPLEPAELRRLVESSFGSMVKLVVDVRRDIVAVGGELHADAEELLIEQGSAQGNPGMVIADEAVREQVRRLVLSLVGSGDPL